MAELIYIDTNVWISLFKQEKDCLRPISDFSFELFRRALNCEYNILISNWLLNELKNTGYYNESKEVINRFQKKGKLKKIFFNNKDIIYAKKSNHFHDRLHEILAFNGNAKYLITRNTKDFRGDLIQIKLPENL